MDETTTSNGPKGLAHLSNNELDAIATHAGCLLLALHDVYDRDLLPFLRSELERLEAGACDHLMARGVIQEFEQFEF